MAHEEQQLFCMSVRQQFPQYFSNRKVLDCGSLDINGNNRILFDHCLYTGIDVGLGRNVNIVCPTHEFMDKDGFDVIISTECFEHDMYYEQSLQRIVYLLRPGGLFLFTCATTGRQPHGVITSAPKDSPFTIEIPEWQSYYKNLTETDIRHAIKIDKIFEQYSFSVNQSHCDLQFWGIKHE